MNVKESLNSIISYLKSLNIEIDLEEFKYQLETHPDYPSLLTFSDALNFFKVKNEAFKITIDQLHYLPDNFIAVLDSGGKIALQDVKIVQDKIFVNNKIISNEKFSDEFKQIVLLAEKDLEFEEKKSSKKLTVQIFSSFIVAFLFVYLYSIKTPINYILLILTSFVGLLVSVETFKQIIGSNTGLISKLCDFTEAASCKSVVNSKKWSIFSYFNLTDLSILFFGIELLSLIGFATLNNIIFPLSILYSSILISLPVGLLSIYYQWRIEKKWCPLCLLIIGIVWLQAIMVYAFFDFNTSFSTLEMILFALLSSSVITIWFILKDHFSKWSELKEENKKNLRFKKNYSIFKDLLRKEKQYFPPLDENSILIGNKEAKHTITIVTSPFCSHCAEVHKIVDRITEKYNDEILIHINFSVPREENEKSLKNYLIYKKLHTVFIEKGYAEFHELMGLFFKKKMNIEDFVTSFSDTENAIDKIIKEQTAYFSSEGVSFTPLILINNFAFPQVYERKEIESFIADLVEEEKW